MKRRTRRTTAGLQRRTLRSAIANDGLKLHYQPTKIRTIDGARRHGIEALARWHDPEFGEVSPAKFIPLAPSAD